MNRLIIPLFFLSSLTFLGCSSSTEESDSKTFGKKPNIILIIADDLGLDYAPNYINAGIKAKMPNIEKLAKDGLTFQNLWSYPSCTPTRASILTGKYGFRTNVTKVGDVLSTDEIIIQKLLERQPVGIYNSAVFGKWHVSELQNHPGKIGVKNYAGLLSGAAPSYWDWNFTENGETTRSKEYTTTKFTDLAIDWLEDQDNPWFLWLAYNAPHTPFHLPPANLHSMGELPSDEASVAANPVPYYMAMLEAMDTEIGRLLGSLSAEQRKNTTVIFIGDNGTPQEVAQLYPKYRSKGSIYQGGINVPMIVAGRSVGRVGQSEDALLHVVDLFATIADIAGTGVTSQHDSKSFKELLNNSEGSKRQFVYAESGKYNNPSDVTIRNQTHKYVKFTNGDEALYNLQTFPFETQNILKLSGGVLDEIDKFNYDFLKQKMKELRGW